MLNGVHERNMLKVEFLNFVEFNNDYITNLTSCKTILKDRKINLWIMTSLEKPWRGGGSTKVLTNF
jgi:hypothetical protein